MIKLNKTECKLIQVGRVGNGKARIIGYGKREVNALNSLAKKGLVEITKEVKHLAIYYTLTGAA